jgi:two-component system, NarL family, nitrate/nitrite response regulator NarL
LLVDALARETQCQMIQSPSSVSGVLETIKSEKPQVAVISAQVEHSGNFELVREIRNQSPATRVIVLLDSSEQIAVIEAFRAGAHGVFCRTEPFRLLGKCIQCVANGQIWANSRELHFLLEALAQPKASATVNLKAGLLSAREIDVVMCVAEGLSNREIAQRLKLTEHTIKNYLFRIFDKLGVSSRVEVVLYALRNGNGPQVVPAPSRKNLRPVARGQKTVADNPVTIR